MVKITIVESSRSVVFLRVEGRMIGSSVEELRRACDVHTSLSEFSCRLILRTSHSPMPRGSYPQGTAKSWCWSVDANLFMTEQLKDGASSDQT